ncbi:MAG: type II toxin-antitoxin system HicA family toxin [Candidatus Desulfaltia sp.]|nr:type II toxin-antitoxin system HicA family toxin [Candidatus Desulfaltia sp.]
MAKLRVLSGKDVCAILEKHGFVEVRRRGSHVAMQCKTTTGTVTIPVPDHGEVLVHCDQLFVSLACRAVSLRYKKSGRAKKLFSALCSSLSAL